MIPAKLDIQRVTIVLLLGIAAALIASATVGRDIYYGYRDGGLLSFAIVSLAGYLFFLFIPVEVAFVYYLSAGENVVYLLLVAVGTALFSQTIDYLIGYSFSQRVINRLIGRNRYEQAESKIRRYGNISLFVFNVLPLSSPVISLAAGMLKHRIIDTLVVSFIGLSLKYIVLALIF